ncbi:MAG: hypothetical protein JW937_05085 [Candidatus Omnitrophica bacterium]|nr:hypothetical protein [Candidatus Omnitrophota bacterium]
MFLSNAETIFRGRFTRYLIGGLALVLLGALAYLPSLQGEFVYDDVSFIVENTAKHDLSQWPSYFLSSRAVSSEDHQIYRPLRTLSYALEWRAFGAHPWGYHCTQVVLHLLNVLLAWWLGIRVFGDFAWMDQKRAMEAAWFGAAVFLLHPVQVESVYWISSRGDLLYAFFALWALLAYRLYLVEGKRWAHFFSTAATLLALLSKETAVVLPFLLLTYAFCLGDRIRIRRLGRLIRTIKPHLILVGVFFLVRLFVVGSVAQRGYWAGGFWPTLWTVPSIVYGYFELLLFPHPLYVIRQVSAVSTASSGAFWQPLILMGTLAGALLWVGLGRRWIIMALALAFWTLLPVSNLVPFRGIMAEHFLYLAVLGFGWILGAVFVRLWNRSWNEDRAHKKERLVPSLLAFTMLLSYGLFTLERGEDWQNEWTLWSHEVEAAPASFQAHIGLGLAAAHRQDFLLAEDQFRKAISLRGDSGLAHYGLSLTLMHQNPQRLEESMVHALLAQQFNYPQAGQLLRHLSLLGV